MKTRIVYLVVSILMAMVAEPILATSLITIGRAQYGGSYYNLIYDDDNNGKSLIWLDYSNYTDTWYNQKVWAESLLLDLYLYPGYTVAWDDNTWRLPVAVDGPVTYGYDGTTTGGENVTTCEMGHLYYIELGNKSHHDINGVDQPDYGLKNTGEFENLGGFWYWSGTEALYAGDSTVWDFDMQTGGHYRNGKNVVADSGDYALAVRAGQVAYQPVPEPATIWLFGSSIAGIFIIKKKRRETLNGL